MEVPSTSNGFQCKGGLIYKFKLLPQGHQYALTIIDILMYYTWCITIYNKEADEVMLTYVVNMF